MPRNMSVRSLTAPQRSSSDLLHSKTRVLGLIGGNVIIFVRSYSQHRFRQKAGQYESRTRDLGVTEQVRISTTL
jgi:hypothetical protein